MLSGTQMQYIQHAPINAAPQTSPLDAAAILFIAVVTVVGLYVGGEILKPLALAGLLSFVLAPVIRLLVKLGVGKTLSVVTSVISAIGLIVIFSAVMAQQIGNLAGQLPTYETNLREKIRTIKSYTVTSGALDRVGETLKDLKTELDNAEAPGRATSSPVTPQVPIPVEIKTPSPALFDQYSALVTPLLKPVAQTGLVILFLLFILLQREDLRDRVLKLAGTRDLQRSTVAMTDAGKSLSKFFLLQFMLNAGFGLVITVGLMLIGVPNALLWGMLAGLMRFVPFIGSLIAAVFPILLAASVDPGWSMVIATAALFLITEPLAGHVIEPLVYGKHTGLSPFAVVVATIFWTLIWGPVGLLLATPLTLCLVVLGNHITGLSMLTVLLGDQPALTPPERLYQRLLVGDAAEAESLAEDKIEASNLLAFYQDVTMPALRLAQADAQDATVPVEYLARLTLTLEELTEDLEDHALMAPTEDPKVDRDQPSVVCLGAKGWVDDAGAIVMANVLNKSGVNASTLEGEMSREGNRNLIIGIDTGPVFCICTFGTSGAGPLIRYAVRRIQRQNQQAKFMACIWDADPETSKAIAARAGIEIVTTTLKDAIVKARGLSVSRPSDASEKFSDAAALPQPVEAGVLA
jgi:predicted PurR-regulated permease PerM